MYRVPFIIKVLSLQVLTICLSRNGLSETPVQHFKPYSAKLSAFVLGIQGERYRRYSSKPFNAVTMSPRNASVRFNTPLCYTKPDPSVTPSDKISCSLLSAEYCKSELKEIKRRLEGLWPEDIMLLGMSIFSNLDFDRLTEWSQPDISSEIATSSLPENLGVVSTAHESRSKAKSSEWSCDRENDQAYGQEEWTLKFEFLQKCYDGTCRPRVQVFTPCGDMHEDNRALQALKNKMLRYQQTGAIHMPNKPATSASNPYVFSFLGPTLRALEVEMNACDAQLLKMTREVSEHGESTKPEGRDGILGRIFGSQEPSLNTEVELQGEIDKTAAKRDRLYHMSHALKDTFGKFDMEGTE